MNKKRIDLRTGLNWLALASGLALCSALSIARADGSHPAQAAASKRSAKAATRANGRPTERNVAQIRVGSSTDADVKMLIGTPWRTTNYGESHCGCYHQDLQEVWEYRALDSSGPYTLHIEFDDEQVAQVVAKIREPSSVASRGGKNVRSGSRTAPKSALRAER